MKAGAEFFDENETFQTYRDRRHRSDSPNDILEKPVLVELLGDVRGTRILDLGCGDGLFGVDLLAAGCQSYLGLDSSQQMVQVGQQNLQETSGQVNLSTIEGWHYPAQEFDLVVSRLALHYVADLDETFRNINRTLVQNGRFVFSIVHPVITSSDKSRKEGGRRQDWIVDDYFSGGPRQVHFQGKFVEQYHRTVEEIFRSLQDANFHIEQLRESCPQPENFRDGTLYERRKRIPLFLLFAGRKEGNIHGDRATL